MREHQEVDNRENSKRKAQHSRAELSSATQQNCLARPCRTVLRSPAELSANMKAFPSGTVHCAASSLVVPTEHWNVVKTI